VGTALASGVLIRPRFGAADESQLSIRGSGLRNNFHLRGVNVLLDGFPYGNADGFSEFIKKVFDAEEKLIVRNPDESIMHAEFALNGGTILFGQAGETWPPFPAPMYLVTQKVDELYGLGIENGAEGNMEPQDKDYGRAAGFIGVGEGDR
jgi:uncharacterized glyoxalase superfamily protein PhnB